MSWLTEFAGKAENFLNKIDKTTATVLSPSETIGQRRDHHLYVESDEFDAGRSSTDLTVTPKERRRMHERNDRQRKMPIKLNGTKLKINSDKKDEELINFLNEPNSVEHVETNGLIEASDDKRLEDVSPQIGAPVESDTDANFEVSTNESHCKVTMLSKKVRTLENEIRRSEARTKQLSDSLKAETNQLKQTQENERLLVVVLSEKNELLQSFKEQLTDKENEIKRLKQRCRQLKSSKESAEIGSLIETNKIDNMNSGQGEETNLWNAKMIARQQEHEQLMAKLEQQIALQQEQLQHQADTINKYEQVLKDEHSAAELKLNASRTDIARLEDQLRQLSEELATTQIQYEQAQVEVERVRKHLALSNAATSTAEQELREYKARAGKILTEKDGEIKRLISMKNQLTASGEVVSDDLITASSHIERLNLKSSSDSDELVMLRAQCDQLIGELQSLRDQNTQLRSQIDRVSIGELPAARVLIQRQEEHLKQSDTEIGRLKTELESTTDELRSVQECLDRSRNDLSERIRQRDEEIERLQQMLISPHQSELSSGSNASIESYEKRVKSLTENLVEKQTLVEQLYRENSQLQLQLHDFKKKCSSLQEQMQSRSDVDWNGFVSNGIIVERINSTSRSASLNAYEHRLPRKVKKAYNQLESFR